MQTEIIMPKLGLTMTEGRIVQWLAADGAAVRRGQPVVEIATDKIVNEVESPADGTLRIAAAPDSVAAVGQPIGYVEAVEAGEASREATAHPEAAIPAPAATPPGGAIPGPATPAAGVARPEVSGGLGVMRRAIAERMVKSWTSAPHVWVTVRVKMEAALRLRESMRQGAPGEERPSVNDIVVAAAARALREHPALNASFEGGGIVVHPSVNVGIAVALDDGLIVPVVKDADSRSLREIARESRRLVQAARSGTLGPDDVSGGTFTVTNLGMFGVESFGAIINQPECAILAVGAIMHEPAVRDGALVEVPVARLTLSFDHRVVDGATAARFLGRVRAIVEDLLSVSLI